MAKRPSAIYVIAIWWWISFSIAVFSGLRLGGSSTLTSGSASLTALRLVAMGLFIWELIALVQLRPKAVWAFVVFLGLWSMLMLIRLPFALAWHLRAATFMVAAVAINVTAMWYMARPTFRVTCTQFRKDREAEVVRRNAEEYLRRSLR